MQSNLQVASSRFPSLKLFSKALSENSGIRGSNSVYLLNEKINFFRSKFILLSLELWTDINRFLKTTKNGSSKKPQATKNILKIWREVSTLIFYLSVVQTAGFRQTNVAKSGAVQKAYFKGELKGVFGWVYDVGTGELINLKIDIRSIADKFREIYLLNKG